MSSTSPCPSRARMDTFASPQTLDVRPRLGSSTLNITGSPLEVHGLRRAELHRRRKRGDEGAPRYARPQRGEGPSVRDDRDLARARRRLELAPEPSHPQLALRYRLAKGRRGPPEVRLPYAGCLRVLPPQVTEKAPFPGAEVDLAQCRGGLDGQSMGRGDQRGRVAGAKRVARPHRGQRAVVQSVGELHRLRA